MATTEALQITLPGTRLDVVRHNHSDEGHRILRKVQELCKWQQDTFPGSQPISLTRTNMADLNRMSYVACEKTDGVRFLMYIASRKVFLIDRMEKVQMLKIFCPLRYIPQEMHQNTLIDGELVTDIISVRDDNGTETTKKIVRFLVYDGITMNGQSISELNLLDRLRKVYLELIKPRLEYEKQNPVLIEKEKLSMNYLEIYLKDFFEIWDIPTIANFSKRLPHLSDGLIFTRVTLPYTPGSCPGILKWKPPHLNTVDFFAEIIPESQQLPTGVQTNLLPIKNECSIRKPKAVRLLVGQRGYKCFTGLWLALEGEQCMKLLDQYEQGDDSVNMTIWECYYDFNAITKKPAITSTNDTEYFDFTDMEEEIGGWCVERIRTDKTTPNDERVIARVFESINDGVSFGELLDMFHQYRQNGKRAVSETCIVPEYYKTFGSEVIIQANKKQLSSV